LGRVQEVVSAGSLEEKSEAANKKVALQSLLTTLFPPEKMFRECGFSAIEN
jgi:hypothetical protein